MSARNKIPPGKTAAEMIVEVMEDEEAAKQGKTADKKRYYDLKRRILNWEKDNYTKLAVLDAGKGWYKLFNHSAIIFACQIAKRLGVKAELISDTDYDLTTDTPVYLFKDFDKFETRLKTVRIFLGSKEDGVYVFDLGYKVDAADLAAMMKEKEQLRARANKLVLPHEAYPALRNELRLLAGEIYEVVRKMNPAARELVGDSMLGVSARMFENFVEAANGHTDMRQYLKTTIKDLRRLDAKLLLVSDLRLIEDSKTYQLILRVGKAQKRAASALLKVEKKLND